MTETAPIKFDLERPEAWQRRVHVEVPSVRVDAARSEVVEKLRRRLSLPGFRKGRVPVEVVRQRYSSQIEEEALERIIPAAYRELLEGQKTLRPVAEPRVENLHNEAGEPLRFELAIEVRPELSLKGYKGLRVQKVVVPIGEDRVDRAMADLAERNARWVPVSREAVEGDALKISYAPLLDGGQPDEKERVDEYAMLLGGEGVLPEFNAALVGLRPGEDTRVEVHYPDDYPNADLAGSVRRFHVKVLDVREKRVPALDDDLAQSVSPHQTLDALRAAVREELERASERESRRHLHELMIDRILAANEVPVPPTLEARYLQAILHDLERAAGGPPPDPETAKALEERYRPLARRSVQRIFILEDLLDDEGLAVTDADVQTRIEEMAREREASPEDIRRALEANKALGRLRNELEEEAVFRFLEEHAEIEVIERGDDPPQTQGSRGGGGEASDAEAAESKE